MTRFFNFTLVLLVLFSACRPDEDALDPRLVETISLSDDFGNRLSDISIGENYETQVFFDLQTNSTVASLNRYDWDIALSNDVSGRIYLNSAIISLRAAASSLAWSDVTSTEQVELGYDLPDWSSLALDDVSGLTLVIDRGVFYDGSSRGILKMRADPTPNGYTLTVAQLDGSDEMVFDVVSSENRRREWVSLDDGQLHNLPGDDEWDILFGSYLHVFDPETNPNPYQVTGVLLNPEGVLAYESDAYAYDEYSLSLISGLNFRADRDLIGYDWKVFDFDLGFVTNEEMIFTIKSTEDDFYALRFTTFYDDNGAKGNFGFTYRLIGDR